MCSTVQVPSPLVQEQFQTVSIPNRPPLILAAEPSIWALAWGGTFIVLNLISAPNRGDEITRLIPIAWIAARTMATYTAMIGTILAKGPPKRAPFLHLPLPHAEQPEPRMNNSVSFR